MAYKNDCSKCMACHTCMGACPMGAISVGPDGKCVIDSTKCISCGTCAAICPAGSISPDM